jgi:diketogulonate reductase-like aldo/keto reductase
LDGEAYLIFCLSTKVYEMTDKEAEQAVFWALETGYKHVDSAEW